jgi:hypothetical protein
MPCAVHAVPASLLVLASLPWVAGCAAAPARPAFPVAEETASAERGPWSLHARLGLREMAGESWDGLDTQSVIGLAGVYAPADWPVGIELGLARMHDTGKVADLERSSETFELALGVRKEYPLGAGFDFVLGAGGVLAHTADYEGDDDWPSGDDVDGEEWTGAYLSGAILLRVGDAVRIGLEARLADGEDLEIDGVERDGNHEQYALTVLWEL